VSLRSPNLIETKLIEGQTASWLFACEHAAGTVIAAPWSVIVAVPAEPATSRSFASPVAAS
jgi:hypothetical protein